MAWFPLTMACLAAFVAALTDIRRFKVYNALTMPVVLAGVAFHGFALRGAGFGHSAWGLVFAFLLLVVPYAAGGLGAGDVKFLMAMGAWLGAEAILPVVLIGCICTGFFSAVLIFKRGGISAIAGNLGSVGRSIFNFAMGRGWSHSSGTVQAIARQADRRERLVPFSAMLAIGVWCVVSTQMYAFWTAGT